MKTKPSPEMSAAEIADAEHAAQVKAQIAEMLPAVRSRIGAERELALSGQPPCIANGGFATVLQTACTECAGHPQPVVSAACRVLQLCGSSPKPEDLAE